MTSATWVRAPVASLMPMMVGSSADRATSSGSMLRPVRPGTLYMMMGRLEASDMALWCS